MENIKNDYKKFDWDSVGLDFGNWEDEKLWALEIPRSKLHVEELKWLLDCPFWTNDDGVRWSVTPRQVLEGAEGTSNEQKKVLEADVQYPIDIFFTNEKWLILDGLHRLIKLYRQGNQEVVVRVVSLERLPEILSGDPIEMPSW